VVGNEGDVDIGLSDEEGVHKFIRHALMVVPAAPHTSIGYPGGFAKIIRKAAALVA
jgi:hypothetical protein